MEALAYALAGGLVASIARSLIAEYQERKSDRRWKALLDSQLEVIRDLHARLAARSPAEYRAWTEAPQPLPDIERKELLYDDTGLIDVELEDGDRRPPVDA
jgi:hypothetical protein